jgi:hypothetical protein
MKPRVLPVDVRKVAPSEHPEDLVELETWILKPGDLLVDLTG